MLQESSVSQKGQEFSVGGKNPVQEKIDQTSALVVELQESSIIKDGVLPFGDQLPQIVTQMLYNRTAGFHYDEPYSGDHPNTPPLQGASVQPVVYRSLHRRSAA